METILKLCFLFYITCPLLCCGQITQTYYVTPNTSVRCPGVPCYNLTTYVRDPDLFFQNDSTFVFLPGVHRLDSDVIYRDLINIQLRGSNDAIHQQRNISRNVHQYGFNSYDSDTSITYYESSAQIQCDGPFGIAFVRITNLSIYNLSILNCGSNFGSALYSNCSLYLTNVINFEMDGVSIQNGSGFGLQGRNVLGNAHIVRSSFIGNNQFVKNQLRRESIDNYQCEDQATMYTNDGSMFDCQRFTGGNVFFWYTSEVNSSTCYLHFSFCVFALGVDGSIMRGGFRNYYCYFLNAFFMHGTGLSVNALLQSFDVIVSIRDSVSYRNQAGVGANLLVVSNEVPGGTVLTCTNTSSVKGIGDGSGIEVYLFSEDSPRSLTLANVLFTNSTFECNYNLISFPVHFDAKSVYINATNFNYSSVDTRNDAVFTDCRFLNSNYLNDFSSCTQCHFANSLYIGTNHSCYFCQFNDSSYLTTNSLCEQCQFENTVYTGNHSLCSSCQFRTHSTYSGSNVTCSSCQFTADSHFYPINGSCSSCQFTNSYFSAFYSSCDACQLTGSIYNGVMNLFTNCTLLYSSSNLFHNASTYIGCVFLHSTNSLNQASVVTYADCTFDDSSISAVGSVISLRGSTCFANISSQNGGRALSLYSSTIVYEEGANVTFINNVAVNGGAVYMDSLSSMNFPSPQTTRVSFLYNTALISGGAIFADDAFVSSPRHCFFNASEYYYTIAYFEGNRANEVGSVLYGGNSICRNDVYDSKSVQNYITIAPLDNTTINIASDPVQVLQCGCNGTDSILACPTVVNKTLYLGEVIQLSYFAVDPNNVIVPGIVLVYDTTSGFSFISAFRTSTSCDTYSIELPDRYTNRGGGENSIVFHITTQKSFLIGQTRDNIVLNVQQIPCPVGFEAVYDPSPSCVCENLFIRHGISCNISDQTLTKNANMWIGYVINNSSTLGIIDHCPYDYCNNKLSVPVADFDSQCAYNRTNVLCGHCQDGLSTTFGTSQCKSCTHYYLLLIIPFALMGVALVGMLFLLNMTVSNGTLNGLIFYANIIRINDAIFLPGSQPAHLYSQIVSIFIAWLNLDFGIESCFYHGMDSYAKTWFQFVFPTYIFGLVGAIILAGRCSSKISNLRAFKSAVSVLATLILLSFSKFLRTTITIFSFSAFDAGNITTPLVWTYDGSLKYFELKHSLLFSFGILITVLLILPYTTILLLLPCLQSKSDWRVLKWVIKLKPLFDSYAGPYKDRYRFWSGVLIGVRFPLYTLFASTESINVRLLGIVIAVLLYCLLLCSLSVYKNWSRLVLEMFFHLNLLAITITYLFDPSPNTNLPVYAIVQTGIGCAFVCFVAVIIAHVGALMREKGCMRKCISKDVEFIAPQDTNKTHGIELKRSSHPTAAFSELREPLIYEDHVGVM